MFVVELKNNCPSTCFPNTAGAFHSSVAPVIGGVPPNAIILVSLPESPAAIQPFLAVLKSLTSAQAVPFHASVFAFAPGPPLTNKAAL